MIRTGKAVDVLNCIWHWVLIFFAQACKKKPRWLSLLLGAGWWRYVIADMFTTSKTNGQYNVSTVMALSVWIYWLRISLNCNKCEQWNIIYKRWMFSSDLNIPRCCSRIYREIKSLLCWCKNIAKNEKKKVLRKLTPLLYIFKQLITYSTLSRTLFSMFTPSCSCDSIILSVNHSSSSDILTGSDNFLHVLFARWKKHLPISGHLGFFLILLSWWLTSLPETWKYAVLCQCH